MTTLASQLNQKPEAPAQETRPLRDPVPPDAHGWWWGTGRRKTAVARCRLRVAKEGEGKVQVQRTSKQYKTVEEYFSEERDRADVFAPLRLAGVEGKLDVVIRPSGGGIMGQAQAARLAIARALVGYDPTTEGALRDAGFLTRDAREVERKKYGQPGARRRFQFSKR
ncbi:MAG TPA: 30S ribosomal protein S9 [Phycisphaerales bacterium]|nr:30S ribosomal protein S9 [Phycisphaerales bacterium]